MRRIYSISLAGLFIVNTLGGICILCYHHYRVHHIIESINRTEDYSGLLHQVKIASGAADKLLWFEAGHEFRFEGMMYDVVRTEIHQDGSIIYHCIRDEKENEINRNFADEFNHSSPGQNHDRTLMLQVFKFFSNLLFAPSSDTFADVNEVMKNRFTYMDEIYPVYLSIPCEPPNIV